MGKDRVNSKEAFTTYTTAKYENNVRESLKKGKIDAYNNTAPSDIPVHKDGNPTSVSTEVEILIS